MHIHINSSAIRVTESSIVQQQKSSKFNGKGYFRNSDGDTINVIFEGYIDLYHSTPWTATMTFQENDDIDIFGAITGLNNNTLSVILLTIISNITYNR